MLVCVCVFVCVFVCVGVCVCVFVCVCVCGEFVYVCLEVSNGKRSIIQEDVTILGLIFRGTYLF